MIAGIIIQKYKHDNCVTISNESGNQLFTISVIAPCDFFNNDTPIYVLRDHRDDVGLIFQNGEINNHALDAQHRYGISYDYAGPTEEYLNIIGFANSILANDDIASLN